MDREGKLRGFLDFLNSMLGYIAAFMLGMIAMIVFIFVAHLHRLI
jgi:hypothetical protein